MLLTLTLLDKENFRFVCDIFRGWTLCNVLILDCGSDMYSECSLSIRHGPCYDTVLVCTLACFAYVPVLTVFPFSIL